LPNGIRHFPANGSFRTGWWRTLLGHEAGSETALSAGSFSPDQRAAIQAKQRDGEVNQQTGCAKRGSLAFHWKT
jgi:hypothetical protein